MRSLLLTLLDVISANPAFAASFELDAKTIIRARATCRTALAAMPLHRLTEIQLCDHDPNIRRKALSLFAPDAVLRNMTPSLETLIIAAMQTDREYEDQNKDVKQIYALMTARYSAAELTAAIEGTAHTGVRSERFMDLVCRFDVSSALEPCMRTRDALYAAARYGSVDCINLLLGVDGPYAVHEAVCGDQPVCVDLLLKHGYPHAFEMDEDEPSEWSLLHLAICHGYNRCAEVLIRHGLDVNEQDEIGRTPIFFASDHKCVSLLLKHGARINDPDHDGRTPIFFASDHKCASLLLNHGARVDVEDEYGVTPVSFASFSDNMDLFKTIIMAINSETTTNSESGDTLLHDAMTWAGHVAYTRVKFTNTKAIKILVECGVPLNARNNRGETALIVASIHGFVAGVRTLLELGCDASIKDNRGLTALGHAHHEHSEVTWKTQPRPGEMFETDVSARYMEIAQLIDDHAFCS